MSIVFQRLEQHSAELIEILNNKLTKSDETHSFPWANEIYLGNETRRAHLDVVDARSTKKLYMMHLCIFPKTNSPCPVFGFDLIAGPNKVTGAFLDFSPITSLDHPLCEWFKDRVSDTSWSKERKLPDWASAIFSPSMVAAGNISEEEELNEILELSKESLIKFLDYLSSNQQELGSTDYTYKQNNYCINQKKNPHTPRVMESLGFDKDTINNFIHNCLFPEVT